MPAIPNNGASDEYIITTYNGELLLLGHPPLDCGVPPVGCFLAITGSTHTDVSTRGASDGTVTVGISGQTGTTTWYLNGEFVASGVSEATGSYQFTSLVAGTYDVIVEDSHSPDVCVVGVDDIVVLDGEFRTGDFSITSPTGLTAVENPVIIGVSTAINNPNPAPDITTLTIAGTLADGFSLTFNLTSPFAYTQTFYAKAYPNKPNYFLASILNNSVGVPVGSNTATEICTSLAEVLQLDAVIPKVYYINNSSNVVTLAAKETGIKFSLDSTNCIASTTGITVTQTQVPTDYCDGQLTDNYSISTEVMVNTDSTNQYPDVGQTTDYNRVAELILPFSQNNTHRFDISSILKSQVSTPMPSMLLTGSTLLPTVMQPYYCRISELYPLVQNTNTVKKRFKTESDVQWTINSALDRFAINDMSDYLGHPYCNINPNWTFGFTGVGGFPYSTYDVVFNSVLLNTGDTGTTNVKISIWNYDNTSQVESWRAYTSGFNGLAVGTYYGRVSGTSEGTTFVHSRSFYQSPYNTGQENTVYTGEQHDVAFLTNSPNPKQIQRASNEFLYFILPKDYGYDLYVKGDLYFYDGTESLNQTFFTIATGGTNAGGCMIMNLSYDKLGLAAYEVSGATNRKIKRAEIAVWQENGYGTFQYTQTKTYRFEIDEMPRKFGILFQNTLGMYDAFDFIGVVEETIDRSNDTYTVPLGYNSDGSLPKGFKNTATYNTKVTKKVVLNTGWIDNAHFDWLIELMKSNNIYSTSTDYQNYLNLVGYTYKQSSLDDLFDIEATFDWTIYENNITV